MKNSKVSRKAIMTLANFLAPILGRSEALRTAWKQAKQDSYKVQVFEKTSGEKTKRVVSTNITRYYTPKGQSRPKPQGLKTYVDMVKLLSGLERFIVSFYSPAI